MPERESSGGGQRESPDGERGRSQMPGETPTEENNGLADVISRGRIDSVMYVYFGDKFNDYHKEEAAGRIIQVSHLTGEDPFLPSIVYWAVEAGVS